MKPLIYGYMRAPDDVPDDELTEAVEGMKRFAEAKGFCYATAFFECVSGMQSGLLQGRI